MISQSNLSDYKKLFPLFCLCISVIHLVFNLLQFVNYSNKGLDFSDESFYLLSSDFGGDWGMNVSLFGIIYSFIFQFLEFNIKSFRIFGLISILLPAIYLSYISLKNIFNFQLTRLALAIEFGLLLTNIYYFDYLRTPSYNTLYLSSSLFVLIFILLLQNSNAGWVYKLLLLNLFLFFNLLLLSSRPFQVIPVFIMSIFFIAKMIYNFFTLRKLLVSVFTLTLTSLIFLLVINFRLGSFSNLVSWVTFTWQWNTALNPSYDFTIRLKMLPQELLGLVNVLNKIFFTSNNSTTYFIFMITSVIFLMRKSIRVFIIKFYFVFVSAFLWLYILVLEIELIRYDLGIILFITSFLILFYVIIQQPKVWNFTSYKKMIVFNIFLFSLIILLGFGSGNGILSMTSLVGGLSAISILISLSFYHSLRSYILFFFITFFIAAQILIQLSPNHPYRSTNLQSQDRWTLIGERHNNYLFLNTEQHNYLTNTRNELKKFGWIPDTKILQLSQWNGGIIYGLGGDTGGIPLTTHLFYPGWKDSAELSLKRLGCNYISKAWLHTDDPPNPGVGLTLMKFSINFPSDYEKILNFYKPKTDMMSCLEVK
jgi:hypothetical protein